MPKHEFGIMPKAPITGKRYDEYNPRKYNCISVDDDYIEPLCELLLGIDFFWHTVDVIGKGLAYYGITLISPTMSEKVLSITRNQIELKELNTILEKAIKDSKYVIHFGI